MSRWTRFDWHARQTRSRSQNSTRYNRRLRVEALEDRQLLAAVVGVDFDADPGTGMFNWLRVDVGQPDFPFSANNLTAEDGSITQIDFDLASSLPSSSDTDASTNIVNPLTLPIHAQNMTLIDGFTFVDGVGQSLTATWSGLDPDLVYEVYVFGLEAANLGLTDQHSVSITGGGSPVNFSQGPLTDDQLWVNASLGDSTKQLGEYAVLQTPNVSGEVVVQVTSTQQSVVLGGLAIRERDIIVNSTSDNTTSGDGLTTLREAIIEANQRFGPNTILFDDGVFNFPKTISLTGQLPTITEDVTIAGSTSSSITIDAQQNGRIIHVDDGNSGNQLDVSISNLSLTGGSVAGGDLFGRGAAVFNSENLTITGSTIHGNTTTNTGGGVFSQEGLLTIVNSTISGNSAAVDGGGIFTLGAAATADISHSTIAYNSSNYGGGFNNSFGGAATLSHTIVAKNTGATGTDIRGTATGFYNLIGDASWARGLVDGASGNIVGVGGVGVIDPMIDALADNGGPTMTHSLQLGSPAIDTGDLSFMAPPDTDQRGVLRKINGRIDIGAVELSRLVVNDNGDLDDGLPNNGTTTLREALAFVATQPATSFIEFDPTEFGVVNSINIGSQLPTIVNPLTITGPGQELLTIDAGNGTDTTFGTGDGHRIFAINDNNGATTIEVTLSGLTLTGGDVARGTDGFAGASAGPGANGEEGTEGSDAEGGGAIRSFENLTLTDMTVTGNAAGRGGTGGGGGDGGIGINGGYGARGGGGGRGGHGGGIASYAGNLTISQSTIADNSAGMGGKGGQSGNGGEGSDNGGNSLQGGDGGLGGRGGGIYNTSGNLTIIDSTLSGNGAGTGGTGGMSGNAGNGGTGTGGNAQQGGDAGFGGHGGGVSHSGGNLVISGSTFSSNWAGDGGDGGLAGLAGSGSGGSGSSFGSGSPGDAGHGGGIIGNPTISASTIVDNRAGSAGTGGFFGEENGNGGSGGGIFGGAIIVESTITGNAAGLGANFYNVEDGDGGGISGSFTMTGSILANNTSYGRGDEMSEYASPNVDYSLIGNTFDLEPFQLNAIANGQGNVFDAGGGFIDPLFGPLADNGGPTQTRALLPGSPALDAGSPPNYSAELLLDDYSTDNFATNYNFVDLFGGANNTPLVVGDQAQLNVVQGTGAQIWNQGESLSTVGDAVTIDFGFNYPIAGGVFVDASAGLALFDSVTGTSLLAEIRVETDEAGPSSPFRFNDDSSTTDIVGTPVGLMTLSIEVIASSGGSMTVESTLSAAGITTITHSRTLATSEIFFGPVAYDVAGGDAVHDDLRYGFLSADPSLTDQRGFSRTVDSGGGLRNDIGAYEAQFAASADFDTDGDVDGFDFLAWQRGFGTTSGATKPDGNSDDDGDVDSSDLAVWELQYGTTGGNQLAAASSPITTESSFAAAAPDSPLSNAELVDLALALELNSVEVDEREPMHETQVSLEDSFREPALSESGSVHQRPGRPVQELASNSNGADEDAEVYWLQDELLERVFS